MANKKEDEMLMELMRARRFCEIIKWFILSKAGGFEVEFEKKYDNIEEFFLNIFTLSEIDFFYADTIINNIFKDD